MPGTPVLVPTAKLAPGVCFLSGDHNGPFLDTGKSVPGRGRIYLSLKALGPLIRKVGWVPVEEVETELGLVQDFEAQINAYRKGSEAYDALVEAIAPFVLPAPAQRVEVAVFKDDRVRAANDGLKAENKSLRAELHALQSALETAQVAAVPAPTSEGSAPVEQGAVAPTCVEVPGGEIDLSELLKEDADIVVLVAEEWPSDALEALIEAEAEGQGREEILALTSDA